MKIKIAYSLLLVLVIVGCMPQSKYTPNKYDVPQKFRIADVNSKRDTAVIDANDSLVMQIDTSTLLWKKYFRDAGLVTLIQKGLENNFDVRVALKKLEQQNLQFKQANMEFLPTISGTVANSNWQYRSENFYSNPSSNWYNQAGETAPSSMYNYTAQNITGLNFNWEIDVWGKIRSQKAQKKFSYLATVEAKNAIQTKLVSEIASGYYQLLLLYAQLNVAESNFGLSERTLRMVELQYKSGNTTALAKQQTKSQMLVAKALIPSLKQQISEQENELQFLTGALPSDIAIDKDNFDVIFQALDKSYEVPLEMVKFRPDIRQAEYELFAANAKVGVAQTNQYPRLVIDLGVGVNSMLPQNWFNIPGSLFGSIIGGITQPIFNKNRNRLAFKSAKLDREMKEIDLQKKVYQSIVEISNVLTAMKSLDEQIEIAAEQVKNSQLTIFQSNLLFNSGYATYLEVINAQRVALESELRYNKLKEDRIQLKIKMYKALGGGW